jgi:recombination protein RecR
MKYPPHLIKLIQVMKRFPGVGSKTAERYAFQLLSLPDTHLQEMALLIKDIHAHLKQCECCGCLKETFSDCHFCVDDRRERSVLCVIASPREAFAIDETRQYRGLFHVLGGLLSPMDGRGPNLLAFEKLKNRIIELSINEVIIALDSTLEGDATAHYLKKELGSLPVQISRLALGLPMGSSLEFIDGNTLAQALSGRRSF